MKIYYAFAIVALLCSNLLSASEKPLIAQNSKIEKVTVFLQGATIERSASVQLRTGVNELVFDNLSPDIIENSIQLRGLKDASILSIAFNLDYLDKDRAQPPVSERARALATLARTLFKNVLDC